MEAKKKKIFIVMGDIREKEGIIKITTDRERARKFSFQYTFKYLIAERGGECDPVERKEWLEKKFI